VLPTQNYDKRSFNATQEIILADYSLYLFVRLATMGTKFELEGEDRFVTFE